MSRIKRRRETGRTVPAAEPSTGVLAAERVDDEPADYSAEDASLPPHHSWCGSKKSGLCECMLWNTATRHSFSANRDRWAVFQNPGPGTYRGKFARRGVLPVGCEVSLPPEEHADAVADGLEFVRWAKGAA